MEVLLFLIFAPIIATIIYLLMTKRIFRLEEKVFSLEKILNEMVLHRDPAPSETEQNERRKQNESPKNQTSEQVALDTSISQIDVCSLRQENNLTEETHPPSPNLGKSFQIPAFIKDNWLAAIGSTACVIGVVFFGITSGLLNRPEMRLIAMLVFSSLLFLMSARLNTSWRIVKSLLRSTAGAIILFSAAGAGYIEGLKCINNEAVSICLLCAGAALNIYLALIAPFQMIASAHVILSLVAFCIAPQNLLFLPLSAVVTLVGMMIAYRSKWDLHLILILLGFSAYNMIWTRNLNLDLWMHYLAILCVTIVGLVAASIHYSKIYRSTKRKGLPIVAHLSNWILLSWNLLLHAQLFRWSSLIFLSAAIAGFFLSRIAKKKDILWLYHADTCSSQFLALFAIVTLFKFSITALDITILAILEVAIFNLVHNLLKERFLIKFGYFIQNLLFICFSFLVFSKLLTNLNEQLTLYLRMGIVIAINAAFYIYGRKKNFIIDSFPFLFEEGDEQRGLSLNVIFSTLLFIAGYTAGFNIFVIQCIVPIALFAQGCWRAKKEDLTSNLSFFFTFIFCHLCSRVWLMSEKNLGLRIDFLSLVPISMSLLFMNMLRIKSLKINIHNLVIYVLAIQVTLLTSAYCRLVGLYIPLLAYLGYALLVLVIARYISAKNHLNEALRIKVLTTLLRVGIGFILFFLCKFTGAFWRLEMSWKGIPLRPICETLGCAVICYWMIYASRTFPNTKSNSIFKKSLVGLLLGFITLSVLIEVEIPWMPLAWSLIALGLILCTRYIRYNQLYTRSWLYLIASVVHVAIANKDVTPSETFTGRDYLIPTLAAICIQLSYAFIAHKKELVSSKKNQSDDQTFSELFRYYLFKNPTLIILLPVFLEIALFFAHNFEKTLLTLFWVGLSFIYLTLSLLSKSKGGIHIAMTAIILCSIRLLVYDLVQSDLTTRAVVFLGVGVLMVLMSMMYKKYRYRIKAS